MEIKTFGICVVENHLLLLTLISSCYLCIITLYGRCTTHGSLNSNLRLPLKINHVSKENSMQFGHNQMKAEVANSKVLLKLTNMLTHHKWCFFNIKGFSSQQKDRWDLSSTPAVWQNTIWTCIITCCYTYLYFFLVYTLSLF